MTVSLRQQADAVELAFLNQRGHVNNLVDLVEKRRRPQSDLDIARLNLPALEAAAKTFRFMVEHEKELRTVLKKAGADAT